ncbi:MAG: hypothetical protein ACPGJS_15930 [Flammeovirgaceae bacterium]
MTRFFLAVLLVIGLISCNEQDISPNALDGIYTGTFSVIQGNDTQSTSVELEFEHGTFHGTSAQKNHPAIGTGAFRLDSDGIEFTNASFWTGDFDWNLILNGDYQIKIDGQHIELTKTFNQTTYRYYLVKSS